MKRFIHNYYHYLLTLAGFLVLVVIMQYYYPNPNISWDTEYYLQHSRTGKAGLRPIGYSEFLNYIYNFSRSLSAVVFVQYLLYFLSILSLLAVVNKIFGLSKWLFVLLGWLMLAEPTGIYHCIAIYSDLFFSTLTWFYLATLLYFIHTRKWLYLLLHIPILFLCLETRFISLFYPFFSMLAIVLSLRGLVLKVVCVALLFGTFKYSYNHYIRLNQETFGVAIHSAFKGWTLANNVMYALPRIHLAPKNIRAPHLKDIHEVMSDHVANSPYMVIPISTDYVWDLRSPLYKLLGRVQDSMRNAGATIGQYQDMFVLAPRLEDYGMYIQKHYPYEYVMGYMVPNIKTMIDPHDGEMGDYYVHPDMSDSTMMRYNITEEDVVCRKDIFNTTICAFNAKIYRYRLVLLVLSIVLFIALWRHTTRAEGVALTITISFVGLFMLMMLYSSWFMYRYILPVMPVMTVIVVLGIRKLLAKGRHLKI